MSKVRIGIDPGHGGKDPGAISQVRTALGDKLYTEEADVNLKVALHLEAILKRLGYEVVMTRRDDKFLELSQRSRLLNKSDVECVICIHCNASVNPTPNYVATYIYKPGGRSEVLGKLVQAELVKATRYPDKGVRAENFHMVRETHAPAILPELGFISNVKAELDMYREDWIAKVAIALANGIDRWVGEEAKHG